MSTRLVINEQRKRCTPGVHDTRKSLAWRKDRNEVHGKMKANEPDFMRGLQERLSAYQDSLTNKSQYQDVSGLWSMYRKEFGVEYDISREQLVFKTDIRSYGVNRLISDRRIDAYLRIEEVTSRAIRMISEKTRRCIRRINSVLCFGSLNTPLNLDCPRNIKRELLPEASAIKAEYARIFGRLGWYYSHNSFKSFYYYYRMIELIEGRPRVLEIGSGACNFAMILMSECSECEYVCVDLPDVIPAGFLSITQNLSDEELEVFLPHEIESYTASQSKKKLVFITPDQINSLGERFTLVVNHESFAEMPINVVNKYLETVKAIGSPGMLIYLVNRFSRQTDRHGGKYSTYTFFEKYDLNGFRVIHKEVDRFRAAFKGSEVQENCMYLGELDRERIDGSRGMHDIRVKSHIHVEDAR